MIHRIRLLLITKCHFCREERKRKKKKLLLCQWDKELREQRKKKQVETISQEQTRYPEKARRAASQKYDRPEGLLRGPLQFLLPRHPQLFHLLPALSTELLKLGSVLLTFDMGNFHHLLTRSGTCAAPLYLLSLHTLQLVVRREGQPGGGIRAGVGGYGMPGAAEPARNVEGEEHAVEKYEVEGDDARPADAGVADVHLWNLLILLLLGFNGIINLLPAKK